MRQKQNIRFSCEVRTREPVPEIYGIEMYGAKVIDLQIGQYTGGCTCSTSNDRNKYDKESNTIICKNYNQCLSRVWKHLHSGMKAEIKENVLIALGEQRNI